MRKRVRPCIYSDERFNDRCVAPVLARGTTTIATDEVRHFVHAVIRCRAYHGTDIQRPETAARNR
jgi:hypothetical protein